MFIKILKYSMILFISVLEKLYEYIFSYFIFKIFKYLGWLGWIIKTLGDMLEYIVNIKIQIWECSV